MLVCASLFVYESVSSLVCLFVCDFVFLFVCGSVCKSACLFVRPFVFCESLFVCVSFCCESVCLFVSLLLFETVYL